MTAAAVGMSTTTTPLTGTAVTPGEPANPYTVVGDGTDQVSIVLLPTMEGSFEIRYRPRQGTPSLHAVPGDSSEVLPSAPTDTQHEGVRDDTASISLPSWLRNIAAGPQPTYSAKMQDEFAQVRFNCVEDHIAGVPRFAALQDSADDWSMVRRFGPQASRVLLKKENELQELSEKIHKLDEEDKINPTVRNRLNTTKHEVDDEKGKLENDLETKIDSYYGFVLKCNQMSSLRPVSTRDFTSVHSYMIQNRPFKRNEDRFFLEKDDLVYTRKGPRQTSGHSEYLDEVVEQFASPAPGYRIRNALHRFLEDDEAKKKSRTGYVHHFSAERRTIVVRFISATVAVAVILGPVWILYLATAMSPVIRVVVILIFIIVCLAGVSIIGDWGAHELFLMMAAYTAILVALLSNLNQSCGAAIASQ